MTDTQVDQFLTFVLVHYNAFLYKKAENGPLKKEMLSMETLKEFHAEFDKLMTKYQQRIDHEKPI